MSRPIDIHNLRRRLEEAERRLHDPLSARNKELILGFEKQLFSEGLTPSSVEKHVVKLRKVPEILGMDLDAAKRGY